MDSKRSLFLLIVCGVLFSGCVSSKSSLNSESNPSKNSMKDTQSQLVTQTSVSSEIVENVSYLATFEIYTNGTKRIFTESKYHNQSPDVFIDASNPATIQVKKAGVTWNDFFSTLPFTLTKECLITGTKQTFCSSKTDQSKQLRFFLNKIENPNALDLTIQPGDSLRVTYGN